jgi:hypothetical protein
MKKLLLLLVTMICLVGAFAPSANALRFVIEAGDQPFYIHGPGYWVNGVYWVWIPGHWGPHHRHWFPGHYAPR